MRASGGRWAQRWPVPESVVGDPFLPEALRELLGLKTNAARFARDAYLLHALAQSRTSNGRLDLLVGKTSTAGDPLRPSRLLLRCADVMLPQRVRFLFRSAQTTVANPPWRRAWKLTPRRITAPTRVAVTALRAWLACPFRFYLARVLRMEAVDPTRRNWMYWISARCAMRPLEAMGRSLPLRDCIEAPVLRDFLLGTLEEEARKRFGRSSRCRWSCSSSSPVSGWHVRLKCRRATRAEGWLIECVEENFELDVEACVSAERSIASTGMSPRAPFGCSTTKRLINRSNRGGHICAVFAGVRRRRSLPVSC